MWNRWGIGLLLLLGACGTPIVTGPDGASSSGGSNSVPGGSNSVPGGSNSVPGDSPSVPGDSNSKPGDGNSVPAPPSTPPADPLACPNDANDPSASLRQTCVRTINNYRSTVKLPPLKRWCGVSACMDNECRTDTAAGIPHSSFGA